MVLNIIKSTKIKINTQNYPTGEEKDVNMLIVRKHLKAEVSGIISACRET